MTRAYFWRLSSPFFSLFLFFLSLPLQKQIWANTGRDKTTASLHFPYSCGFSRKERRQETFTPMMRQPKVKQKGLRKAHLPIPHVHPHRFRQNNLRVQNPMIQSIQQRHRRRFSRFCPTISIAPTSQIPNTGPFLTRANTTYLPSESPSRGHKHGRGQTTKRVKKERP
jgi:hypothetical protein